MIVGELLQTAAAKKVSARVANVRDAQLALVQPCGGYGSAHATLFGVLLRGFKNAEVCSADSALQLLGLLGPVVLGLGDEGGAGIIFGLAAILHDCFHRQGASYFAVGFSA